MNASAHSHSTTDPSQPSRKRQRSRSMLSDTSSSSVKRSVSDGPSLDGEGLSSISASDDGADTDAYMTELGQDTYRLAPATQARTPNHLSVPPTEKITSVETAKSVKLQVGETWYLVDRNWWKRWRKACAGVVDKDGAVTEEELEGVDNSSIVDANGSLRPSLSETVDYELVPPSVWADFEFWYGVPKWPLPRKVISRGVSKEAVVELYPLRVYVLRMVTIRSANESEPPTLDISIAETVGLLTTQLEDVARPQDLTRATPARVWKLLRPPSIGFETSEIPVEDVPTFEGEIVDSSETLKTLEEAGIMHGDTFVVEYKAPTGPFVQLQRQLFQPDGRKAAVFPRATPFGSFGRSTLRAASPARSIEPGTLGLGNMGNTCFMNSALQCLAHQPELVDYFLTGVFQDELNPENPLGMHGAIAEAFGALLQKIWAGTATSSSYSPRDFKTQLQRFAPQFSGYQQHDSQELVAFLLDGLHEDLNRVLKKPYVEKPDWEGGGDRELVQLAQKSWDGYMLRNDSVIVDLFQGQYQSTLVCPECEKVSITFDPFMYLTLPLPIQKKWKHAIHFIPWDISKPHLKIPVEIGRDASFKDLKVLLGRWVDVPADNLLAMETFSHKFYKSLDDSLPCGEMSPNDVIVCYELPCHAQQSRTYKKQPGDPLIIPVYLSDMKPASRTIFGAPPVSYGNSSNTFGHPMIAVIDSHDATSIDAIYNMLVDRLRRWTKNARDLLSWEAKDHPVDSIVEIKIDENSPAVEGDIVDEKIENEDVMMEVATATEVVPTGPKPDLFTLRFQEGNKEYGTSSAFGRTESIEERMKEAGTEPMLVREGDVLVCEFDDHMKAFYFGSSLRFEDALWDSWMQFVHPEFEESQRESESKRSRGISLQDCLDEFTKQEKLGEDDLWYCPQCKKHQQASKKFDLWKVPDVLVVHLKRFSNSRALRDKIDALVDFPVHGLDLGKMVGERAAADRLREQGVDLEGVDIDEPLIYDLFGGRTHGRSRWWPLPGLCSESRQQPVTANAYLLFYRRRTSRPLGGKTRSKVEEARSKRPAGDSLTTPDAETLDIPDDTHDDLDIPGLTGFRSATNASSPSSPRDEPPDLEDGLDMPFSDPLELASHRFDLPDPSSNKASPASSTEADGDPEEWNSSYTIPPGSPGWSPPTRSSPAMTENPLLSEST
ncbi:unnamed protein product [Mycena citricolor]|uniref:ubiquitinyl hydrolase 1 n=1 Tax=Mycena citricolor TaxID=2018698 RepID=A0AAD2HZ30_9AGAR|nr:unnamed protein product [Mycena citricolor]